MPPMLATIGIKTARATTCSIVSWNKLITPDAIRAVSKFIPSHIALLRVEGSTGANMSSSSVSPAILSTVCSLSSLITSTTSSIVILPRSILFLSTTGAETKSLSSKIFVTSFAKVFAFIEM